MRSAWGKVQEDRGVGKTDDGLSHLHAGPRFIGDALVDVVQRSLVDNSGDSVLNVVDWQRSVER